MHAFAHMVSNTIFIELEGRMMAQKETLDGTKIWSHKIFVFENFWGYIWPKCVFSIKLGNFLRYYMPKIARFGQNTNILYGKIFWKI